MSHYKPAKNYGQKFNKRSKTQDADTQAADSAQPLCPVTTKSEATVSETAQDCRSTEEQTVTTGDTSTDPDANRIIPDDNSPIVYCYGQ